MTETDNRTVYEKAGDYTSAQRDFVKARPRNVHFDKSGLFGTVNGRFLQIRKQGYYNNPAMYFVTPSKIAGKDAHVDIIVYKVHVHNSS